MEHLVTNLSTKVKKVSSGGRDYLVAPITLIVPGVLNGSQGALYYPKEEVVSSAPIWEDVPILVNHPKVGGRPVSANYPNVLEETGIGFLKKPRAKSKLVADGWFDIEKTKEVDPRILSNLLAGTKIEVSTGLDVDQEEAPEGATFNGEAYFWVAKNYKPDHLAILPDNVGACSLKDGCGVFNMNVENLSASDYAYVPDPKKRSTWKLRIDDATHVAGAVAALGKGFRGNKVEIPAKDLPAVKRKVRAAWRKFWPKKKPSEMPEVLNELEAVEDLEEMTQSDVEELSAQLDLMVSNQASHDDIREQLRESLNNEDVLNYHYVSDVYNDYFVYECGTKKYKRGYTLDGATDLVTLSSNPGIEVRRVSSYVPVSNEQKKLIDSLIANGCCWKEEDRPLLETVSVESLTKLQEMNDDLKKQEGLRLLINEGSVDSSGNKYSVSFNKQSNNWLVKKEIPMAEVTKEGGEVTTNAANTTNSVKAAEVATKPLSFDEWMKAAPKELQSVVRNAMAIEAREKGALVEKLVANAADDTAKEAARVIFNQLTIEQLQPLVSLMPKVEEKPEQSVSTFFGSVAPLTQNSKADEDDVLPLPVMNWGKEGD